MFNDNIHEPDLQLLRARALSLAYLLATNPIVPDKLFDSLNELIMKLQATTWETIIENSE